MRKAVCFLFSCLFAFSVSAKAKNAQEPEEKTQKNFVDDSKSFSENLRNLEIPDSYRLEEVEIGNKQAPHTLIVYSSFSCNHCRKFHEREFPELKKLYVDTGKVKVILRNYIDDLGALEAAILMRSFYKKSPTPENAIKLYRLVFGAQKDWMKSPQPREFLKQMFVNAGYSQKDVSECLDVNGDRYKKISAGLMKEQQRAMHELRISSVPAFVLDDRVHQGVLTCDEIAEKLHLTRQYERNRHREFMRRETTTLQNH